MRQSTKHARERESISCMYQHQMRIDMQSSEIGGATRWNVHNRTRPEKGKHLPHKNISWTIVLRFLGHEMLNEQEVSSHVHVRWLQRGGRDASPSKRKRLVGREKLPRAAIDTGRLGVR